MKKLIFALSVFLLSVILFSALHRDSLQIIMGKKIKEKNVHHKSRYGSVADTTMWAWAYGGYNWDIVEEVRSTSDGGYIVGAWSRSFGDFPHIWLIKLFADGSIEWQKAYGGPKNDAIRSIEQTIDGGYIVASVTRSFYFETKGTEYWVKKLNAFGGIEWQKVYGGANGESQPMIKQTMDGGHFLCGYTFGSFGHGKNSIWVLKLNSTGNILWQKVYSGIGEDRAWGFETTTDGGCIVVGNTTSFLLPSGKPGNKILIFKLDHLGDIEWQKIFGGDSDSNTANSICQTSDGGYIFAGTTYQFSAGKDDFWIVKLNAFGEIEWQKAYGGVESELPYSIQQTMDNGYIAAGHTYSFGSGWENFWIIKMNTLGNLEWAKAYGGKRYEYAKSIRQTMDGGYIVAGQSASFGDVIELDSYPVDNILVIKLSPNGETNPPDLALNTNAIFTEPAGIAHDVDLFVEDTNTVPLEANAGSYNTNSSRQIVNVTQLFPPVDIRLTREMNQSFFVKEAWHTISWQHNSANNNVTVLGYRVFRKNAGESDHAYVLQNIDLVPSSENKYVDKFLNLDSKFVYVVAAVDEDGAQSRRSEAVRN